MSNFMKNVCKTLVVVGGIIFLFVIGSCLMNGIYHPDHTFNDGLYWSGVIGFIMFLMGFLFLYLERTITPFVNEDDE